MTDEGRTAAMVLQVVGITLFAAITATITSRFVLRDADTSTGSPAGSLPEVAALDTDGILTDEEYATKSAELLARM